MTDRPTGTALAVPPAVVGGPERVVGDEEVEAFIADQRASADLDGRRVCVVVPDGTRTCPLPLMLGAAWPATSRRWWSEVGATDRAACRAGCPAT